jgi:hypothetical protein
VDRGKTEDDSSQVTGSSVFDFDGDGRNEVVYNDEAYIRIYPGVEPDCALNPPGPGCDKNMTDAEVLFRDRNSSRTRTEYPVIADVDGDFKADIVFSTNNDSTASLVKPTPASRCSRTASTTGSRPARSGTNTRITSRTSASSARSRRPSRRTGPRPMDEPYNSYRRNAQGAKATTSAPRTSRSTDLDVGVRTAARTSR